MDGAPASSRLHTCIRDLAALNALPSMCIERTPHEALDIVLDALPTALSCDLVLVVLPDGRKRATFRGRPLIGDALEALAATCEGIGDRTVVVDGRTLFSVAVELPMASAQGRLVAAKTTPFALDTERVLVRSAGNIVGTTLATAQSLEAATRKDEFLAMLGHELRNPLAPILTAVEILARHPAAERERDVIERHTRHLARLVDDLLDISRVTRGHIQLRREPVSLANVIERAVELAAPLVTRNRQSLVLAPAGDTMLEGDPVRLAQVFGNILTNAAKFTPQGGRIELGIERAAAHVRVFVRDEGRGIAREQLTRIFEPFVQIDRVTDASRGGLGLGLAIVKDLVDRHGGTIEATSDGLGRGSTFAVTLPVLAHAEDAPQRPSPPPAVAPSRAAVKVLVVDDNVDVAELLAEALASKGFETAIAFDAHAALERWRTFAPNAAVLDVGLPDVDGYELARTIRREYGSKPTLLAATGYGQDSDRLRSADAGFDGHFVKPVSIGELVRALDAHVVERG